MILDFEIIQIFLKFDKVINSTTKTEKKSRNPEMTFSHAQNGSGDIIICERLKNYFSVCPRLVSIQSLETGNSTFVFDYKC